MVERSPAMRDGGQNVDVRGAGREVARRMDIEDTIRAATTGERGTRFVRADGTTVAEFAAGTSDTGGVTAELEILRGDFARLLYDRTKATSEYVFGDRITALRDEESSIVASFAAGRDRAFDVVVAADGIGSTTRRLVIGDSAHIKSVGLYTAWLTIPRTPKDDPWWRWMNAPRGRTVTLRPDNHGTTRAALSFLSAPRGYEALPVGDQHELLRQRFRDAGWETNRILQAFGTSKDFYFEHVGQVKAPQLWRGRAALVGDAGYCASPISGMGTSLALVGAYVLAGELSRQTEPRAAFTSYERIMRPYIDKAQKLPPGAPRIVHPQTTTGIRILHGAIRVAASRPARYLGSWFEPPAEKIDLPAYG